MSKAGDGGRLALLARALQRLAAGAAYEPPLTVSSNEGFGLPRLGGNPVLSASLADLDRAAAAILAEPGDDKPRHAGGRRRLHWEAIRRAYDAIPQKTLASFDTDAKLYRCLDKKLKEGGIVVSTDTMGRALDGYRGATPRSPILSQN